MLVFAKYSRSTLKVTGLKKGQFFIDNMKYYKGF